jgi:hypothetical protein
MGTNTLRLLRFALDYPGWHSMGSQANDRRSMATLEKHGLLEVMRYGKKASPQFRIRQPKNA